MLNNTKFIRGLDAAFSKLSKLRDPQLAHENDPFENTSLTRSSLEASLGLGRKSKANKGMQQLTASEAMERHRNRMKEKETLAEKARTVEGKIKSRK